MIYIGDLVVSRKRPYIRGVVTAVNGPLVTVHWGEYGGQTTVEDRGDIMVIAGVADAIGGE